MHLNTENTSKNIGILWKHLWHKIPTQHSTKILSLIPGALNSGCYWHFLPSAILCPCFECCGSTSSWFRSRGKTLCGLVMSLPEVMFYIHFHCYLPVIDLGPWHALKYELCLSQASLHVLLPKARSKIIAFKVYLRLQEGHRVDSLRPKCPIDLQGTQLSGRQASCTLPFRGSPVGGPPCSPNPRNGFAKHEQA